MTTKQTTPKVHLLPKGESIAPMPKLIPTMQMTLRQNLITGAFSFIVPTPIPRVLVGQDRKPVGMRSQFK
jgi:tRNA A37 threonylcarbamoyladenosine synthetase subunit TsaC/SUA5/YrdC